MSGDLVVMSLEPWDAVWRRNQHLVHGLLMTDPDLRVLFVEPVTDPLHDVLHGGRPRQGHGPRPVGSAAGGAPGRLWTLQPTKFLPRRLDRRGDARRAAGVVRTAQRLGMSDPILWVNDPAGAVVQQRTGWRAVYDITDDWLEARRAPDQLARLRAHESVLMERCREVVVCSPGLQRSKSGSRPVTLVRNAVDVDAYTLPGERPSDLPPGRCAVYVGTIHADRMDVELCCRTAGALTAADGGRLVLVGPAPLSQADRSRLEDAGVVLLGPRPAASVPPYLVHAHALVVPHVVDRFTDSLDPIKLYEYLAAGRPVVSTAVAGFREQRGELVTVATRERFPEAVLTAVRQSPPPPWRAVPVTAVPRWADRVEEFRAVLDRVRFGPPAPTPR